MDFRSFSWIFICSKFIYRPLKTILKAQMFELTQIKLRLDDCTDLHHTQQALVRAVTRELHIKPSTIHDISLARISVDARKKRNVHFVANAFVNTTDEKNVLNQLDPNIKKRINRVDTSRQTFTHLNKTTLAKAAREERPIVVGAGCAGLFCTLALAEAGLEPLLIERGRDAYQRTHDIDHFYKTAKLNPNSNIQFGLGGAGTFSDGKLNTGTKNKLHRLILDTFVDAGAPKDILWEAKPHIGSDILPQVVTNIAQRILALGGEICYDTRLMTINRCSTGAIQSIIVRNTQTNVEETIKCKRLVLATGHSARDIFMMLNAQKFKLERKTFAMGVRIEHLQAAIDAAQYGPAAGHPALSPSSYKLVSHLKNGRSLYSFCMCPGGEVVGATSLEQHVVTNGMSRYARNGKNANSALLVNVKPNDLPGDDILAGIKLQTSCEKQAYLKAGATYAAPVQLVGDFLRAHPSGGCANIKPTYPLGVSWTSIDDLLPSHVIDTLRQALPLLNQRIKGFSNEEAVLTGVETRSSSPITILRDKTCHALEAEGLYPCGEGAGYAGGIMSAATDGLRCAQAIFEDLQEKSF